MGRRDDVSSRILIMLRDYAAMKLGVEIAHPTFETAVRDADCTVARATDPRAWVPLEVLESVVGAFQDTVGPTFAADAATWIIPYRRELSAMSLSTITTPHLFYAHLDRARSFFARHVRFETRRRGPGRIMAVLHYRDPGLPATNVSCLVGRGVLQAVPLLFDLPPAIVEERACRNQGAEMCVYDVTFRRERPLALAAAAIGAVIACVGALLLPSLGWFAPPLAGWILGREIQLARTRGFMARVTEEHRRVLAEQESEFLRRFEEIKALNEMLERRPDERSSGDTSG